MGTDETVERAARRPNELGPNGQRVAANLERLRKQRGLTMPQLRTKLSELGRQLPATGVIKTEQGDRRVDVDDLVALALALNVAPNALLLPPDWSDTEVELMPEIKLSTRQAWLWAEGRAPASNFGADGEVQVIEDDDDSEAEFWRQLEEYEALTNPPQRRRAARHPANRAARQVSDTIDLLVTAIGAKDAVGTVKQLKAAKLRMRQLEAELLRMELDLEAAGE